MQQIAESNASSAASGAKYIVQEHATLRLLYEQDGTTGIWRLRESVMADQFIGGFLRMYVNPRFHAQVLQALDGSANAVHPRAQGAAAVLHWFIANRARTNELLNLAKAGSATLLEPIATWPTEPAWQSILEHRLAGSIYWAKLACALLPDLGVAYDNASRLKWCRHLHLPQSATIGDFLSAVSAFAHALLRASGQSLLELRHWDRPDLAGKAAGLVIDRWSVALPDLLPPDTGWPITWAPLAMPIGRVLDKLYYNPRAR